MGASNTLEPSDLVWLDSRARREAFRVYAERVAWMEWGEIVELVDARTGGLGYGRSSPLDPVEMALAGSAIAWPEAVEGGKPRVVEVGTGLGRTCYIIHYSSRPLEYVTIDASVEVLAVALYRNPSRLFQRSLWEPDVRLLLGEAEELLPKLPSSYFDHAIHDGGPNPLKNPSLYSVEVFRELLRVLKPGGTLSVFAGRSRRGRSLVYQAILEAGFEVVGSTSLPGSPALVLRARKPMFTRSSGTYSTR